VFEEEEIEIPAPMPPSRTTALPRSPRADRLETQIHRLINAERAKRGLKTVAFDTRLKTAARKHSMEMQRLGYFDHLSPVRANREFTDRIRNAGLRKMGNAGENLALGTAGGDVARTFVNMWLKSPGHRKNLLAPSYRFTGIGVAFGHDGNVYATQLFTSRLDGRKHRAAPVNRPVARPLI
jgi:uncharacterized protein YkwD